MTTTALWAVFLDGPADGGQVILAEPIRERIRFPLSLLEATDLFEPLGKNRPSPPIDMGVAGEYRLEVLGDRPFRDAHGRFRYRYVIPTPPKEKP